MMAQLRAESRAQDHALGRDRSLHNSPGGQHASLRGRRVEGANQIHRRSRIRVTLNGCPRRHTLLFTMTLTTQIPPARPPSRAQAPIASKNSSSCSLPSPFSSPSKKERSLNQLLSNWKGFASRRTQAAPAQRTARLDPHQ